MIYKNFIPPLVRSCVGVVRPKVNTYKGIIMDTKILLILYFYRNCQCSVIMVRCTEQSVISK